MSHGKELINDRKRRLVQKNLVDLVIYFVFRGNTARRDDPSPQEMNGLT